jgi:mannose-1-phosphate guanylyltransferase
MGSNYYAAIMAGGGGTRLWPFSRKKRPKQALKFFGDRTLFQVSVERILPIIDPAKLQFTLIIEILEASWPV